MEVSWNWATRLPSSKSLEDDFVLKHIETHGFGGDHPNLSNAEHTHTHTDMYIYIYTYI